FAPPGACAELLARRGILTHVPGRRRRCPLSRSERRALKRKHFRPSCPPPPASWHATCKFQPAQRASRASPPARSAYPPSPPRPIPTGQQPGGCWPLFFPKGAPRKVQYIGNSFTARNDFPGLV